MIFNILLGMSISSSALITVILIFRRVFGNRISRRTLAALWLIPAVRLLVPFVTTADAEVSVCSYPNEDIEFVITETIARPLLPAAVDIPAEIPRPLLYVWLWGAVFAGAYFLLGHIALRRRFACALPCGYDIGDLRDTFGIKRRVSLRTSEFADSPFTYAAIKPVIVMPKSAELYSETQMNNILCHELSHIKRFDVLFKTLLTVCVCVHWFNPFVWIMLGAADRDTELACDETALSIGNLGPEEYAMTLIGMAERRSAARAAGFSGGKLEERIVRIMTWRKSGHSRVHAVFAAVLSLAAALLINVSVTGITDVSYAYGDVAVTEAVYTGIAEEYAVQISEEISDIYFASEDKNAAVYSETVTFSA